MGIPVGPMVEVGWRHGGEGREAEEHHENAVVFVQPSPLHLHNAEPSSGGLTLPCIILWLAIMCFDSGTWAMVICVFELVRVGTLCCTHTALCRSIEPHPPLKHNRQLLWFLPITPVG